MKNRFKQMTTLGILIGVFNLLQSCSPSTSIIGKWIREETSENSIKKVELTFAEGGVFRKSTNDYILGNQKCFEFADGKWRQERNVIIVEGSSNFGCYGDPVLTSAYYDAFKINENGNLFETADPDIQYIKQ